ncbi:MAG: hypothetical protein ACJ8MR_05575, partial [Povalibacter sp.]
SLRRTRMLISNVAVYNVDKENFRHSEARSCELGIASESISSIADAQANTADTWDHSVGEP